MPKKIICAGKNSHLIEDQTISKDSEFEECQVTGNEICFKNCIFNGFPSALAIQKHGEQIEELVIDNSKLSKISAADLQGFYYLTGLFIRSCQIEELPGDLFEHTRDLQFVSFANNRIKFIGEGILAPLRSLDFFDLTGNARIDYLYDSQFYEGSFEELAAKVDVLDKKYSEEWRQEIATLKTRAGRLETENVILKARCDELTTKLKIALDVIEEMKRKSQQQKNQPFVVRLNGKEFKVQKQILKTHSKAIARMIDENPESNSLELRDISEESFLQIINFFKTGFLSNESGNANWADLFAASCELEVDALPTVVAAILEERITPKNSLKVLNVCNKYAGHDELKMIAFREFSKKFQKKLKVEWASDPEMLKKLESKLEIDKLFAKTK